MRGGAHILPCYEVSCLFMQSDGVHAMSHGCAGSEIALACYRRPQVAATASACPARAQMRKALSHAKSTTGAQSSAIRNVTILFDM